jgi:hypothetical protein
VNFGHWFLRHTERWLVPLVGYALGGYVTHLLIARLPELFATLLRAVL